MTKLGYETITAYRCTHCMEVYTLDEKTMIEHLSVCLVNPDNKSCVRCKHLVKGMTTDKNDKPASTYFCKHLSKELDEIDVMLTGAECFEKRVSKQIEQLNSPEYETYLKNLARKIEKEMM